MAKDVYFDQGMQGWIRNTARRELWRMAGWYGYEDLVQDGFVCYCKCRDKYALKEPDPGEKPLNTETPTELQRRHFMALVQRTFYNHIMTLSARFAISREDTLSGVTEEGDPLSLEHLMPPQSEEVSVIFTVLQAPAEIGEAIAKLISDSIDGEQYLRSRLRRHSGRVRRGRRAIRETTDERLTRVVGDVDLPKQVLTYLLS